MEVNINKLIELKLNLYSYFICWSLYNEQQDVLVNYITNIDKIETKCFVSLIDNGYIEDVPNKTAIMIEDLKLTGKFKSDVLGIANASNITFDVAFEQLREHYPIKAGKTERRLQGDINRCKILYKNIITKNGRIDEELHSIILQCINYEVNIRTNDRSLDYFQLMATWLQQQTYLLYIKDAEEMIKKKGFVDKPGSKTSGFSDDI
tara:strand:+ start:254 stop:871 length:618 start_codon:yes stop_codon:yes gene_type:complete